MNPKLAALLESGQLDWDNPRHREVYLRAFAAGALSRHPSPAPRVAVTRGG